MRTCPVCGKSLAYKQATALYCSGRCGKRAKRAWERGVAPTAPVERPTYLKPRWWAFKQVAGPALSALELHCASISDRDPETGYSFYEEAEARNQRQAPKEYTPNSQEDPYRYFDGATFKEDER